MATFSMTGRIGKDAELRETTGGTQVCTFSAAYDTGYGDKKVTNWVKAVIFGKRASALAPHLTKGKLVEFVGTPVIATWKDKKTNEPRAQIEVSVLEVTLHGGGKSEDDRPVADKGRATRGNDFDDSDSIPF
jgi:single-strand DNA-binding protein